jgi:hypothetical protein
MKQPYVAPKPSVCDKSKSGQHKFVGYPPKTATCKWCGKKAMESF